MKKFLKVLINFVDKLPSKVPSPPPKPPKQKTFVPSGCGNVVPPTVYIPKIEIVNQCCCKKCEFKNNQEVK